MTHPIKFNEATHRYWLDGKPVQGVTTLIKGGLPAPALTYWSARTVAEYVADNPEHIDQLRNMGRGPMVAALKETPWAVRDEAGRRGTEIHQIAEQLVHGTEVDVPEEIAGHVEACVRFLDEWQPEPLIVEKPVAHRAHWWAGTPDLVAKIRDGRVILFDYKSARSGIFAETAFQLSAYSHAEFWQTDDGLEQPMPPIDACMAVHIRGDGYSVIPVKADDAVYAEFRHIAFVAQTAKRMKEYVLPSIDAPASASAA